MLSRLTAPILIALGSLALFGCSASPATTGDGGLDGGSKPRGDGGMICVPGQQVACPCLGGSMGIQACKASGTGYETCQGCPGGNPPPPDGGGGNGLCGDCSGCCDGTTCVKIEGEDNNHCGPKGSTCAACGPGGACAAGTCGTDTGTCSANNCSGCCMGTTCITATSANACGTGGAACAKCTTGATCSSGACNNGLIDPKAKFTITVTSVKVKTTDPSGCSWDGIFCDSGDLPDPYVCVTWNANNVVSRACTTLSCNDSASCTFDATTGKIEYSYSNPSTMDSPLVIDGSALVNGQLYFEVWDRDVSPTPDDLMASGYFGATTMLKSSYSTGPFGSALDLTFMLNGN
jgi:hypothetical protein